MYVREDEIHGPSGYTWGVFLVIAETIFRLEARRPNFYHFLMGDLFKRCLQRRRRCLAGKEKTGTDRRARKIPDSIRNTAILTPRCGPTPLGVPEEVPRVAH